MTSKKDYSVFKIYLIYFISMALFSVVRIVSGKGFLNSINAQVHSIIFTVIIQVVVMTIVPAVLYLLLFRGSKQNRQENVFKKMLKISSFKKINFKVVLLSFALGVFAFFINIIVSTIFSLILSILGYSVPTGGS